MNLAGLMLFRLKILLKRNKMKECLQPKKHGLLLFIIKTKCISEFGVSIVNPIKFQHNK